MFTENGKRGYQLTFVIAYFGTWDWITKLSLSRLKRLCRGIGECLIKDFVGQLFWFTFSFPYLTSLFVFSVDKLCRNTKDRINSECKALGVKQAPFVSCRVTQTYHSGAAVYFYYGFVYDVCEVIDYYLLSL